MSKKTTEMGQQTWLERLEHVREIVADMEGNNIHDLIEWVVLNIIHGVDEAVRECQDGKGRESKEVWTEEQKMNLLARIWMANDKAIRPLIDAKKGEFVLATDSIAKAWGLIKEGEILDFETIETPDGKKSVGISKGIGITKCDFEGMSESEQEIIKTLALNNQSAEA